MQEAGGGEMRTEGKEMERMHSWKCGVGGGSVSLGE